MSAGEKEIAEILKPILLSMGLSLWEIQFQKQGPSWLLRIYIDREEGGVTLNDCEAVSRDLGASLDVEDIIPHAYTLEVSSPGLDRKLTKPEHFVRFTGNLIKMKTYQPVDGEKVLRGKLLGLIDAGVKIESEKGTFDIPFDNIAKASLEVEI